MSDKKPEVVFDAFDPNHLHTYTAAITTFTQQVYIQNSLLEKILDNTDTVSSDFTQYKDVMKNTLDNSRKILDFIEKTDGLSKSAKDFYEPTIVKLENLQIAINQAIKEATGNIVLRVALILAGSGVLFNVIVYFIQLYSTQTALSDEQFELLKTLLIGIKNGTGN